MDAARAKGVRALLSTTVPIARQSDEVVAAGLAIPFATDLTGAHALAVFAYQADLVGHPEFIHWLDFLGVPVSGFHALHCLSRFHAARPDLDTVDTLAPALAVHFGLA